MFIAAAAASIAHLLGTDFCLCSHKDYIVENGQYMWDYVQKFRGNILSNLNVREDIPTNLPEVIQNGCYYTPLDFPEGDFILSGAFQSYKYFNESIVQNIFSINQIKEEVLIENKNAFIEPLTSIHIRRGDYCTMPHKLPPVSVGYVKKAMKLLPLGTRFLIISDDMDYCKRHFYGKNIFFMKGSNVLRDIVAPTLCENNIMSNSTFSWWGAYLNPNPNKKVIVPTPWFGPYAKNSKSNVDDLIPQNWIQMRNRLDLDLFIRAQYLGLATKIGIIR